MAVLSDPDRAQITAEIQRTSDCPGGITKPQLRAVYNAMDDWWESVEAAGNAAIPQPQRGILTTKQKAAMFMALLRKRYEVI